MRSKHPADFAGSSALKTRLPPICTGEHGEHRDRQGLVQIVTPRPLHPWIFEYRSNNARGCHPHDGTHFGVDGKPHQRRLEPTGPARTRRCRGRGWRADDLAQAAAASVTDRRTRCPVLACRSHAARASRATRHQTRSHARKALLVALRGPKLRGVECVMDTQSTGFMAVNSTERSARPPAISPQDTHGFEHLSDEDLHASVRAWVGRSNVALAALLAHLGEVESRGIYRNKACASLQTYCVYVLRMSEDAAYRRAKAARFVKKFPVLVDAVASAAPSPPRHRATPAGSGAAPASPRARATARSARSEPRRDRRSCSLHRPARARCVSPASRGGWSAPQTAR